MATRRNLFNKVRKRGSLRTYVVSRSRTQRSNLRRTPGLGCGDRFAALLATRGGSLFRTVRRALEHFDDCFRRKKAPCVLSTRLRPKTARTMPNRRPQSFSGRQRDGAPLALRPHFNDLQTLMSRNGRQWREFFFSSRPRGAGPTGLRRLDFRLHPSPRSTGQPPRTSLCTCGIRSLGEEERCDWERRRLWRGRPRPQRRPPVAGR